ncbi:MAG TPA: fumarylacetoacetate hydrolase family protein [Pseudolabrys sp.]|nr:fumarylacetoacetate hydrolase family protein [Pseudolabrys sp.]
MSFIANGKSAFGALIGDGIVELGRKSGFNTLREAIAAGALDGFKRIVQEAAPDYKLSDVTLQTPVPDAEKVICIGVNYRAHVIEVGRAMPEQPSVFFRLHSSLVASGAPIVRPTTSHDFDYEGELAAVIGTGGHKIAKADALKHVVGYTILQDGSIRDIQLKGSLAMGKNFAATGGVGPCMLTADEVPDYRKLTIETRLNGERKQYSGLDDLIFDIPSIIEYVSAAIPLSPGDIIATGTPDGVQLGKKPPKWMQPGDVLEIEVPAIGILRNKVVDATS